MSTDTRAGGEEVSEAFEGSWTRSGGLSLRFLVGDVVMVVALFPCGNKALELQTGNTRCDSEINGQRRCNLTTSRKTKIQNEEGPYF